MNIAQRLQDKGIQIGIQEGIQKARRETAQQLFKMKIDIEIILKATGLTHQDLLLLTQENTVYSQQ
ncbi:hypothetical protein OOA_12845 [Providencia burhodogranariea DSM 19968]|uniref:Transposase n=1 Tax=Providencia burhodogranariea DSM 19968 TaxID=1141662 RepID=K8WIE3_9GAMM|nr:hypothetical protein OOA_12845 [Providencia burhodogranariea DSM 19968]